MIDQISFVIVTFNSAAILSRCLSSLPDGAKIIIVDNASEDETLELACAAGCQTLCLDENRGYGTAANRGIELARTPYVFLLNPDILLQDGCLEQLYQAVLRHPGAAMLGPRQSDDRGHVAVPGERYAIADGKAVDGDFFVNFLVGSALFIDRARFTEISGFDENLFLYFEENDLCRRFLAKGYDLVFVDRAHVLHNQGTSSQGIDNNEAKLSWHMAWSKQYIRRKNDEPSKALSLVFAGLFKVVLATISGNRRGQARYWGQMTGILDFKRGIRAQDKKLN